MPASTARLNALRITESLHRRAHQPMNGQPMNVQPMNGLTDFCTTGRLSELMNEDPRPNTYLLGLLLT
jgi:hypothetical protein